MGDIANGLMPQTHIESHIDLITQHEQEFLAHWTTVERLGDSIAVFVGSFQFVCGHILLFVIWMAWNVFPGSAHFDPSPFSLLGTMVAMEAIVLASFILMRRARMGRRADERDHLMLQIMILTEKEITAVLKMDRQIAQQVGAENVANTAVDRELSQQTSIDEVAQTIRENLYAVSEIKQVGEATSATERSDSSAVSLINDFRCYCHHRESPAPTYRHPP